MLNNIYKAIKEQLTNPTGGIAGDEREGLGLPIDWYNVQYDGIMANEKGVFVEFPDKLQFTPVSKQMRRAPVTVRLHIYSKAVQTHNGIADATVEEHEAIAVAAQALIDGFTPVNGSCQRLQHNAWQHWHRWKGWMVTFVEFETKKVL